MLSFTLVVITAKEHAMSTYSLVQITLHVLDDARSYVTNALARVMVSAMAINHALPASGHAPRHSANTSASVRNLVQQNAILVTNLVSMVAVIKVIAILCVGRNAAFQDAQSVVRRSSSVDIVAQECVDCHASNLVKSAQV